MCTRIARRGIILAASVWGLAASGAGIARGLVLDVDGNAYATVALGAQVWLAENVKATRGSTEDPLATYAPDGDPKNVKAFGRLYDWKSARAACPRGWHLPSDAEWSSLEAYLGEDAGSKLRDPEYWSKAGTTKAKPVGFNARPAGYWNDEGFENFFGTEAVFWTATPHEAETAWSRVLSADGALRRAPQHIRYGFSVRCLLGAAPR